MRELLPAIQAWFDAGVDVAVATVIRVEGTAPRPEGAKMAVASDGRMIGSVSGGCVESAVFGELQLILAGGPPRMLRFGISDDMSWDVGLACGGTIDVLLQRLELEVVLALNDCLERDEPCVLASELSRTEGTIPMAVFAGGGILAGTLEQPAVEIARRVLESRTELAQIHIGETGSEVFVEPYPPPPMLILIGGVHVAIPLTRFARSLGFRVVVADPRSKFADDSRFPEAHQVLVEWPEQTLARLGVDESTYVVILTHDPKIDEPALAAALKCRAAYIGAIGSRKTHSERYARMAQWGVSREELDRVYAPVGLDLGGRTPEETALSIMAEIIAVKNGRSGGSLRDGSGRIGA